MPKGKRAAIGILIVTQIGVMTLWFSTAAGLADMAAEAGLPPARLAWLTTAVQLGFALGAVGYALLGLADRFDPRRVFAVSALVAASANLALLAAPIGGTEAVLLRAVTGAALAGVYPVGMKIAVGWGTTDRAFLVSALVGALTVGSASPHLIALFGGADWRATILVTSLLAAAGGLAVLTIGLGPNHAKAASFDPGAVQLVWTNPRIRLAVIGYLGHMWELYALWAWVGVIALGAFQASGLASATDAAKVLAFGAIAIGGLACFPAGHWADRIGCERVALLAMVISGAAAVASAAAYGGPAWLVAVLVIVWGAAVIPDSPQFSVLVAEAAPPERVGSLMTIQTALGFLLTAGTVQAAPLLADAVGWPGVLLAMALGPAVGVAAMERLGRLKAAMREA
ncbi:MAG: MFS transporter [Pseudomonadota bacterium]